MLTLRDRLILPLDTRDLDQAQSLVDGLRGDINVFKIGLELYTQHGPDAIRIVHGRERRVFLDLKMNDIPNTVAGAARAACSHGVYMLTLHTLGGSEMMRAAVEARNEEQQDPSKRPLLLGVTVLTSLDEKKLAELGIIDVHFDLTGFVVQLAKLAQECGLDGVVASPLEIEAIRAACGKNFLIVTPGVRPYWSAKGDQKRVMDPQSAIEAGADLLVIGRPITQDYGKEMGTRKNAVDWILCAIRQGLETRGEWPPPKP